MYAIRCTTSSFLPRPPSSNRLSTLLLLWYAIRCTTSLFPPPPTSIHLAHLYHPGRCKSHQIPAHRQKRLTQPANTHIYRAITASFRTCVPVCSRCRTTALYFSNKRETNANNAAGKYGGGSVEDKRHGDSRTTPGSTTKTQNMDTHQVHK